MVRSVRRPCLGTNLEAGSKRLEAARQAAGDRWQSKTVDDLAILAAGARPRELAASSFFARSIDIGRGRARDLLVGSQASFRPAGTAGFTGSRAAGASYRTTS